MRQTIRILAAGALCCCAAVDADAQNLFAQRRSATTLIEDHSAKAVGDILSIVIEERHKVKNEDKVERNNQSSLAASLEEYTLSDHTFNANVLPAIDIRSSRSFEGDAKQEKDSSLEARVSVVVIDVMPNGNLVVAGSRVVQIDDETKTLRISGLVRRLDVTSTNSVMSSQVADARVSIVGEGGNTRMTTKGPVGVLFDTLIWAAWPF